MDTIRKYVEAGHDYRELTEDEMDALYAEALLAAGRERRRAIAGFARLLRQAPAALLPGRLRRRTSAGR